LTTTIEQYDDDDLGYRQALSELELIVAGLESGLQDVDQLSSRVARGQQLLAYCRSRLASVESEVATLTEDLSTPVTDKDTQ